MSHRITIIGLGAGELEQLPLGIYRLLKNTSLLYARTMEHPVLKELSEEGLSISSFDAVYEKHDRFEEVYEEIVETLFQKALSEDIVYGVPGHPLIAEKTVQLLLSQGSERGIDVIIKGGQSFLDPMFTAIKVDPVEGFQFLDGTSLSVMDLNTHQHIIISQVYDAFIASEVKLTLMERYPDDHQVCLVTGAGMSSEQVKWLPLYELDREMELSNLTSVYVSPINIPEQQYKEFWKLREIIDRLRAPDGCPWDRAQTHVTLKRFLIEEAYELIDAIDQDDIDNIIEELGDVLLQVMLHAKIGEDDGFFSIDDVIESISEKMVRRHPHVFGDAIAHSPEDVEKTWQQVKKTEKGTEESLLKDVNESLPKLMQAEEIQKRAAKVGFDWNDVWPAWEKVLEELEEFKAELNQTERDTAKMADEFGDVLFACVNVARLVKIDAELALHGTINKFRTRFEFVERSVRESEKGWSDYTLEELDHFWNQAKEQGL
ncbi:bifunctional methyltransferase/pyrophosphohydrolase YabN [Pradoshia sp.]